MIWRRSTNYRPLVFFCYSKKDAEWLQRIEPRLRELAVRGAIDTFIDTKLETGDVWLKGIRRALHHVDVAVVLISNNLFATEFVRQIELPAIRRAARNRRTKVIPLLLEECDMSEESWLLDHQSPTDVKQPLAAHEIVDRDLILDKVTDTIKIFAFGDSRLKRFLRRKVWNWRYSLVFTVAAVTLGTFAFFTTWRQLQPELARTVAWSVPITRCKSEPEGSAVQLFERGWMVARFETDEYLAIIKEGGDRVRWHKIDTAGFTKGVDAACPSFEGRQFMGLGFEWWYCQTGSEKLRKALGLPLTPETRTWMQFQKWAEGHLIYGLPSTKQGIDTKHFQKLSGVMLRTYNSPSGTGSMFGYTHANAGNPVWCTAMWHPARKDRRRTELHERLSKSEKCKTAVDAAFYTKPRAWCSLSGY